MQSTSHNACLCPGPMHVQVGRRHNTDVQVVHACLELLVQLDGPQA